MGGHEPRRMSGDRGLCTGDKGQDSGLLCVYMVGSEDQLRRSRLVQTGKNMRYNVGLVRAKPFVHSFVCSCI